MTEREHTLEILAITRAVPFSYDHNIRSFLFGSEVVKIGDVPHYGSLHSQGTELTQDLIEESAKTSAFLHGFRNPVQTLFGQEFIREGWSAGLENDVDEIMGDVLVELNGNYSEQDKAALISLRSIHTLVRRDEGNVTVRTSGICACMGPDFTVHDWNAVGFMEYTPHNIENPAQRASLLAGIGHIAHVANGYVS